MRIVVIGTRGIPGIQGGVETHCEQLYPRIAAKGHQVIIMRRSCYINPENRISSYKGVKLIDIYAPRKKAFEAIIHTFLGVLKARTLNPDIVHIHAVGPSLMVPLTRLLGMKVVMTNHGPDYDRKKWNNTARKILMLGEKWGSRFSNHVIVISQVIADIIASRYNRTKHVSLIYNGVNAPIKSSSEDYITQLGLSKNNYIVTVGRFVEEKGFHDLIKAYCSLKDNKGMRLVIAGDADHEDTYSRVLKLMAKEHDVVLTGFIKGERLNQILTHAALFVLPSYHEGLPIALLEAMSYGLDVAVSNIPANRLPQLGTEDFFPVGDTDALARCITRKISSPAERTYDLTPYQWDHIADATVGVYNSVMTAGTRKETSPKDS